MGKPAARVTDGVTHTQGAAGDILDTKSNGSPNVYIGGLRAARQDDQVVHNSGKETITTGSQHVFIDGKPAARKDDEVSCKGKIVSGDPHVFIGD
jgi:uncharacterized Zn-binding protein involved in type VI secretion